MGGPRLFEIANDAGVDIKTAVAGLERLGSNVTEPTKRLDQKTGDRLRLLLGSKMD